jgi:DNA helicase-2/ATP-dependent DNA helicase PcrA
MTEFRPSEEQEAILGHEPGEDARVLAGPGTGKSATLVAWLDRLLDESDPPKVKLLTFTRAATAELAGKVLDHEALAVEKPSTVHSFAVSVLLKNDGAGDFPQPLRMVDDWERDRIVEGSLARRAKVNKRRIRRLIGEMAAAWESLNEEEDPEVDSEERTRFLGVWTEHRTIYGYTLPAELPYALLTALEEHPDLEGVDFDLLIVDEYQDLNACDLALLQQIGLRGCAVVGAGDDDQSIYSFRKADPAGIRRFEDDYPGAVTFPLSISRRCGRRILDWATHVIEGEVGRPPKPRLTCPDEAADGEVALLAFAGQKSEATGIARLAKQLIDRDGMAPQDILILLRGDHNGQFSKPIKEALDEEEISYSDPDALKRLLCRDEQPMGAGGDAARRQCGGLDRLGVAPIPDRRDQREIHGRGLRSSKGERNLLPCGTHATACGRLSRSAATLRGEDADLGRRSHPVVGVTGGSGQHARGRMGSLDRGTGGRFRSSSPQR